LVPSSGKPIEAEKYFIQMVEALGNTIDRYFKGNLSKWKAKL